MEHVRTPARHGRPEETGRLRRLFSSGPPVEVLHEEYAKRGRIDQSAPVQSSGEIRIERPVEQVWDLLVDLRGWEAWAPDIHDVRLDSAVVVDGRFAWAIGRTRIRSRFAVVEPARELTWTGTALWTTAIDRHVLQPTPDGATRLSIEESLAGALVPLFFSSAKLRAQHEQWLTAAKAAAEGRAPTAGGPAG